MFSDTFTTFILYLFWIKIFETRVESNTDKKKEMQKIVAITSSCEGLWPLTIEDRYKQFVMIVNVSEMAKCFNNCVLTESQLIVNGTFMVKNAIAFQKLFLEGEKQEQAITLIQQCALMVGEKDVSHDPKSCEYGNAMSYCLNVAMKDIKSDDL